MNTNRMAAVGVIALSLAAAPSARAQYTANYQTNIISGVTSNWMGNYIVGSNTFADVLLIKSSGVLSNGLGYVGYESNSINNSVLVTGSGSAWSNGFVLYVGYSGSANSLVISNGGQVVSSYGYVGLNPSASNNSVLVTGTGSVWSNDFLYVGGYNSASNNLVISNGGKVVDFQGELGENSGSNNSVLVTGSGSVWSNNMLYVGYWDGGNSLVISNGGQVVSSIGYLGDGPPSANNSVLVTSTGSVWNTIYLYVGISGASNVLTVAGGSVFATNLIVGASASSTNNLVELDGGNLIVTNGSGTARVVVDGGSLILGAGTFKTDHLIVTNGGAVQYTQTYQVNNGTVTVAGGGVQASSNLVVGSSANATGTVNVTGGQLTVTNGVLGIGNDGTVTSGGGVGSMTVSNGTLLASTILLGSTAGGAGNLTIQSGGFVSLPGSNSVLSVNALTLQGTFEGDPPELDIFNGTIEIGVVDNATMILDGGIVNCGVMTVGENLLGTCRMSAGTMSILSKLVVGKDAASTGIIWIDNGTWQSTSLSTIGENGLGQMTISNGVVSLPRIAISASQNPGTLTVAGGFLFSTNMIVGTGNVTPDAKGTVWITGTASLHVTNAAATAQLFVGQAGVSGGGQGTVVLSNGTLLVDQLLATNGAKSVFSLVGGTLKTRSTTVSNAGQFVVGDGTSVATLNLLGGVHTFANGLRIQANAVLRGCGTISGSVTVDAGGTVLADCGGTLTFTDSVANNGTLRAVNGTTLEFWSAAVNNSLLDVINGNAAFHSTFVNHGIYLDAAGDWDGDGMSNLQEFQAGTDPTNSASVFRITAIAQQDNDVRVTWMMGSDKTNALQVTAGVGGGFANNFADLFIVTNTVGSVTNYLDIGAATNRPSRYYRVRLVP